MELADMRAAAVLAACLAAGGCGGASSPTLPEGWTTGTVAGCCTVGIPPGATLRPATEAIDDPVTFLRGRDFEAVMTATAMGSALPAAAAGRVYRSATRRIDGREAEVASFTAVPARADLPETRHLLWKVREPNDGTGRNLIVDFRCRADGCNVFDPLIGSLRVR